MRFHLLPLIAVVTLAIAAVAQTQAPSPGVDQPAGNTVVHHHPAHATASARHVASGSRIPTGAVHTTAAPAHTTSAAHTTTHTSTAAHSTSHTGPSHH